MQPVTHFTVFFFFEKGPSVDSTEFIYHLYVSGPALSTFEENERIIMQDPQFNVKLCYSPLTLAHRNYERVKFLPLPENTNHVSLLSISPFFHAATSYNRIIIR